MARVIVTGSSGLVGSAAVEFYAERGFDVEGIDNDMRKTFFGEAGSTSRVKGFLCEKFSNYRHYDGDIRDHAAVEKIFRSGKGEIALIIHAAGQPSHDWAARDPEMDFSINAGATLGLLDITRRYAPEAVFIFTSTNKVYGDHPNRLPLVEKETRYELPEEHPFYAGIDETMPVDQCLHSLFGASKLAADVLVQEYGRYFGLKTGVFRAGCLTGPRHAGVVWHGFLSYLIRCAYEGRPYTVIGYQGKQVRDNIHCQDLVTAFHAFFENPCPGEVYNIGGGRVSHCSVREALEKVKAATGRDIAIEFQAEPRRGDHQWYISSLKKFQAHYPQWRVTRTLDDIIQDMIQDPFHSGD